jgi:hypothetical protein
LSEEQTSYEIATESSLILTSSIVIWNVELSDFRLPQRQRFEPLAGVIKRPAITGTRTVISKSVLSFFALAQVEQWSSRGSL